MGAVYEAVDEHLHNLVALKQTFASGGQLEEAFKREAYLLSRLRHSALPRVTDYFTDPAGQFLVMDHIPGMNLAELLTQRGSAFPLEIVLRWAEQLFTVLEYLHEYQPPILHRDIKPPNIKVTHGNVIMLLDFGLAKGALTTIANSGSVYGYTPGYAPLEQINKSGTDVRSDLYSLAATLYYLLTGTSPEDSQVRAVARINEGPDPLQPAHTLNPQVPVDVSMVLMKAMALPAKNRYASVAEMRSALHGAVQAGATGRTVTVQVPRPAPAPAASATPRVSPLFPVMVAEWRDEIQQRTTTFGNAHGYWCYVRPSMYRIGGWPSKNSDSEKVATITLPEFWIARHPVTVVQYHAFIEAGGYTTQRWWTPKGWSWKGSRTQPSYWHDPKYHVHEQPVIGVAWYEAVAFANWLTEQLANVLPTGYGVRLPTEAEWEASAAYDTRMQRQTYPWGESEPTTKRAVFKESGLDHPAAVGQRPDGAAACGAHDMVGNVWEWTMSSWESYPGASGTVVDDFASSKGDVPVRGYSYYGNRTNVLCAARYGLYPDLGYSGGGFRLVLSPCLRTNVLYSKS